MKHLTHPGIPRPCVFHSTEWGPEILKDGAILGNSTIDPAARPIKASDLRFDSRHHELRGVCVTRSFHFARQFSDAIFALDRDIVRQRHRILLRAEKDAYDLADDHGDFRIEAEEFIVCDRLPLNRCLLAIWAREDHADDPEYRHILQHPAFAGHFAQP
jgi:hypothetical protein